MKYNIEIKDQWSDFLIRNIDPYARAKYELILDRIGDITKKSILVVGSGSGELVVECAKLGAKVTALDIDHAAINLTQLALNWAGLSAKTVISKIEDYVPDSKFDIIIATDVIEHIEDDRKAIYSMKNALVSSGQLIITVPAFQILFGFHDELLHHKRRYRMDQLQDLLSPFFNIQMIRYFGFFLIPITILYSKILRKPYPVSKIGNAKKNGDLIGYLVGIILKIEQTIWPPMGTSLIVICNLL